MWSLNGYRITRLASRSVVLLTAYALLHGAFSTQRSVGAEEAHAIPIARLDEELISLDDIRHTIALQVYRLQMDMYTLLKRETEALVDKRLLAREAARRGISIEDLLQREVDDKLSAVTDGEVERYLAEHPEAAVKGNATRPRIVHYLTETRRIARRLDFLRDLRTRAQYEFLLEPPPPPRVSLDIHDAPTRGTPDAPVTLVHFASFSSPLSRRSFGYLQRLQAEFPGRLQWVHRHFLSTPDEVGLFAAQLSVAAHEAGRFWEFHDRLFTLEGQLREEQLLHLAQAAGLDAGLSRAVRQEPGYLARVKRDIDVGLKAGVGREPVVFVNGRYFSGTFPYEKLRDIVADELGVTESRRASQQRQSGRDLWFPKRQGEE
jgi:protein-disulfide isomerase